MAMIIFYQIETHLTTIEFDVSYHIITINHICQQLLAGIYC